MSVVIADASPVNYLILIDCIELLPLLYSRVVIHAAVYSELTDSRAPIEVANWVAQRPDWFELRESPGELRVDLRIRIAGLDAGEREAISLALAESALLLIDERAGRAAAQAVGIQATGTVGILLSASRAGLVDLKDALIRLRKTNFRINEEFLQMVIRGEGYPLQ